MCTTHAADPLYLQSYHDLLWEAPHPKTWSCFLLPSLRCSPLAPSSVEAVVSQSLHFQRKQFRFKMIGYVRCKIKIEQEEELGASSTAHCPPSREATLGLCCGFRFSFALPSSGGGKWNRDSHVSPCHQAPRQGEVLTGMRRQRKLLSGQFLIVL